MKSIRQGRWKMMPQRGSGGWTWPQFAEPEPGKPDGQLYDMQADPAEEHNVYDDHPEVVQRLTDLLGSYARAGRSAPRHR
jgi:arylsulfatase A-like enzyme